METLVLMTSNLTLATDTIPLSSLAQTGESCVAPSSTPEFVDQSVSQVEEIQDKEGGTEDAYNDCSQHSNRLESLDVQEDGFWQDFLEDVRGTIAPKSNLPNIVAQKSNLPNTCGLNATKGVKRKRRESGVSTLLRQHLKKVDERHYEIMGLINQGTNTKKDEVSIDEIMDIMNRISANSDFEVGGDTWCHAMLMFRDPTSREIFFKMLSDDVRNDADDMVFNVVQQHGDYIPMEELDGETSSNQGNMRGSSDEMREIRNNIANMIWNANNVF
ncbi:hypothetical protein L6452_33165 [Arctium lappa]|uniref:Uncharacterized protein n=1 Tax=Arctium lappa TaxID=4217 RepID=A0ACB8Z7R0_ARCLA|nr:hypothetical protein L6452_33165 [Arctium lappa]